MTAADPGRLGLLILALAGAPARAQGVVAAVVYGHDDRADLFETQAPPLKSLADSTVALVDAGRVSVGGGRARLLGQAYGRRFGLCPEERFWSQPSAAFCSGALVGPDLVATAGHCVKTEQDCRATKFVFGYSLRDEAQDPASVPSSDVYGCSKLVARRYVQGEIDYALVRLDRPAARKPLAVERAGPPAPRTRLIMIGHPAGLPAKITAGAADRVSPDGAFLVSTLSNFAGSSGSPVFGAQSGLLEGLLVYDEFAGEDFVPGPRGCKTAVVWPAGEGGGAHVTLAGAFAGLIPAGAAASDAAAAEAEPLREPFSDEGRPLDARRLAGH